LRCPAIVPYLDVYHLDELIHAAMPDRNWGLDVVQYFHNSGNMKSIDALTCLNALAQEHRLNLYRLLVQAGEEGMAVGELAAATGLAGATLTNHLHILRRAGMVSDERRGRVIQCRANYPQMNALLSFLTENCCAGSAAAGCAPATTCQPARRKR
jgi:ArsR family transcriptional regulator, arsenate/arsenite/antimonite-responsive transcriptional repressor